MDLLKKWSQDAKMSTRPRKVRFQQELASLNLGYHLICRIKMVVGAGRIRWFIHHILRNSNPKSHPRIILWKVVNFRYRIIRKVQWRQWPNLRLKSSSKSNPIIRTKHIRFRRVVKCSKIISRDILCLNTRPQWPLILIKLKRLIPPKDLRNWIIMQQWIPPEKIKHL